jgi:hypothetical protein
LISFSASKDEPLALSKSRKNAATPCDTNELKDVKSAVWPFEVLQTADISLVSNMHDPPTTPDKATCHAALVPLVPSFILVLHVS